MIEARSILVGYTRFIQKEHAVPDRPTARSWSCADQRVDLAFEMDGRRFTFELPKRDAALLAGELYRAATDISRHEVQS